MLRLALSLLLILFPLQLEFSAQVRPHRKAPAADASNLVTSEQEGLKGPVRRVRTETAQLTPKPGGPVEGSRKLLAVAVYDRAGRKVSGEIYGGDDSSPTRYSEAYKYDDRGNVVETRALDESGSLVSQEVHTYEFDSMGNWIVMRTSAAVIEDGKVSYEPVEVTYRTITYYLTDSLARGLRGLAGEKVVPAVSGREPAAAGMSPEGDGRKEARDPGAASGANQGKPAESARAIPAAADALTAGNIKATTVASEATPRDEKSVADPDPPPLKVVKEVPGDLLRQAATFLPEPEYPTPAALLNAAGSVKVQVAVNEQGEVTATRVLSGHPLLADVAEQAARRARFSPERLSSEPAEVFGILTFTFVPPAAASSARPAPAPVAATPLTSSKEMKPGVEAAGTISAEPAPGKPAAVIPATPSAGLSAAEYFKHGTDLLAAERYKDAVELLKSASRLDATNHQIFYRLGEAYWGAGLYKEAAEAFRRVVELNPARADAYYSLGNSYHSSGQYRRAVQAYQQATGLKPGIAQYRFALGAAYLSVGEPKSARRQLKVLKQLDAVLAARLAEAVKSYDDFRGRHTGNILNGVTR